MNFSDLTLLLEGHIEAELLEETFHRFQYESPLQDTDDFLDFLRLEGLLKESAYQDLKSETVEVTSLDVLGTYLESTLTQLPDKRQSIDPLPLVNRLSQFTPNAQSAYQLLNILGEGAMGRVHLAKDQFLRRKVAYKELLPELQEPDNVARFLSEVQITSQLAHPHVVPIYGLENASEKSLAYSMKMVQGATLKEKISKAKRCAREGTPAPDDFTLDSRLRIFIQVCHALELAHHRGLIHRDLKPANFMLGNYHEVYVMDWGIARLFQSEDVIDSVKISTLENINDLEKGQIIGTPRYMSPEQAGGLNERLNAKSDIFAMGLILFELITLKQAVQGKDIVDILRKIIKRDFVSFEHLDGRTKIPRELKSIVTKATQRKRADRYPSIETMAHDIQSYLRGDLVSSHDYSPLEKVTRLAVQYRGTMILLLLGFCLFGLSSVAYGLYERQHLQAEEIIRKDKVSKHLSLVANQAQIIDSRFLQFEGALESLYESGKALLKQNHPSTTIPFNIKGDFENKRVPGHEWSPIYQQDLSFQSALVSLAPGVSWSSDLSVLAQVLSPLQSTMRQLFLNIHSPQNLALAVKEQDDILLNQPAPILWSFIGFEKGLHYSFPGKSNLPKGFDPRKRPWYIGTLGRKGITWGLPYPDALRATLVIPCTKALYTPSGKLQGIAGIDISLSFLQDEFLGRFKQGVDKVAVMTPKGKFISKSRFSPSVLEALQAQIKTDPDSGFLELDKTLYSYAKLDTLNWYFVSQVSLDTLLKK